MLLLFSLALISTATAQSQSTSGAIQGTVNDQNGAVIAGATVAVKNLDNGSQKRSPRTKTVASCFCNCNPDATR
jgi:hypothetical protein